MDERVEATALPVLRIEALVGERDSLDVLLAVSVGYQKQYEAERDALKAAIEKREAELAAARATIGQP